MAPARPTPTPAGACTTSSAGRRTIVVDPATRATCTLTAGDAPSGPPYADLGSRPFGDTSLAWHWRQVGLGLLAALALLAAAATWLLRRRN